MKNNVNTFAMLTVLTLSFSAHAQFCKGLDKEPNTTPLKAISCKASSTVKAENGIGEITQSLNLKCGLKIANSKTLNLGGGTGSYSVLVKFDGQTQKEAKSNIKVFMKETTDGLKSVDEAGFPFNAKELTKLAQDAKVNVKAIKTISFYHTSESDYANILVLTDAKGKVLIKGTLIITEDTNNGPISKLTACK